GGNTALNDPGASPTLNIDTTFTGAGAGDANPVENVTLHLPPGQLGNPHATTLCRGVIATDAANGVPGTLGSPTKCTAGQQIGTTTVHTQLFPAGPPGVFVPATLPGKSYN